MYRNKVESKECEFCGNNFPARLSDIKRGFGRYCSFGCRNKGRKTMKKPENRCFLVTEGNQVAKGIKTPLAPK